MYKILILYFQKVVILENIRLSGLGLDSSAHYRSTAKDTISKPMYLIYVTTNECLFSITSPCLVVTSVSFRTAFLNALSVCGGYELVGELGQNVRGNDDEHEAVLSVIWISTDAAHRGLTHQPLVL